MLMKTILVTGGAGYIGSHAVRLLLQKGFRVIVIDNLIRGFKQPIEVLWGKFGRQKLKFYKEDLADANKINAIFEKEAIDGVMHFAALCLVNESMEQPERYFENNVGGSLNLFKAMIRHKVKYLVFSSTCAVYGESQYLPVDEQHPTNPSNPYGESKLITEKMLGWLGKIHKINYAILRYFNVSGASADGLIGDSKKPSQLLVQNAVRGALGIDEFKLTCPQVKTPDKTPIRDYINVEDLVDAHLKALKYLNNNGQSDIFNLGTGTGNSVLQVIDQVKKTTNVKFEIKKGQARKGEYAKIYADIKKAKQKLNWQPKRTISDSIKALVRWYKNHPHGWDY